MAQAKLQTELKRRLAPNVQLINHPQSARVLLLRDLNPELQIGLVVQRVSEGGRPIYEIDLGVRIPSVEELIDAYEVDGMRAMDFPDPEPVGWLTFWAVLSESTELIDTSREAARITSEFEKLQDEVTGRLGSSSDYYRTLLCQGQIPAWASMPRSVPLLIRILACCPAKRLELDRLMSDEGVVGYYEGDVRKFSEWISQRVA